jgi:hypothetical protein
MKFLIYEETERRSTLRELNAKNLFDWVTGETYEKEYEIKKFGQTAELGDSIISNFYDGYFIAVRIK